MLAVLVCRLHVMLRAAGHVFRCAATDIGQ